MPTPITRINAIRLPRPHVRPHVARPLVALVYRSVNTHHSFVTGWPKFSGLLHYPVKRRAGLEHDGRNCAPLLMVFTAWLAASQRSMWIDVSCETWRDGICTSLTPIRLPARFVYFRLMASEKKYTKC